MIPKSMLSTAATICCLLASPFPSHSQSLIERDVLTVAARDLLRANPARYLVVAALRECPDEVRLADVRLRGAYCGGAGAGSASRVGAARAIATEARVSPTEDVARAVDSLWGAMKQQAEQRRQEPCRGVAFHVRTIEVSHLRQIVPGSRWGILVAETLYPVPGCAGAVMLFELEIGYTQGQLGVMQTRMLFHAG